MKWFILLSFLAACSSPTPKNTDNQGPHPDPYTVAPCQCIKIFDPVCAEGQDFGNSCEAQCNGYQNWTKGGCIKSNPVTEQTKVKPKKSKK